MLADLSQYLIAWRIGLTVEAIPRAFDHVNGNRPKDTRMLAAFARVGGDLVNQSGAVFQANT